MNDATGLQLRSLIKKSGELELSLVELKVPEPGPDEVVLRIEASPINPSDLGLLLSAADLSTGKSTGTADRPVLTFSVPQQVLGGLATRLDKALPVGNEGAGTVIKAGSSAAAQALLGKKVAALGGAMYATYRAVHVSQCLVLPEGATAVEGASSFVNPLTALGMVETMRREGHKALVHTAAASNLGQMLNRICLADGVPLVNVVRKPEQEELLRGLGAKYVVNSSAPSFREQLTNAIAETGATIAFDAIGGGRLASQILSAMEAAANRNAKEYSTYGSSVHKQVYIYGGLDRSPTILNRSFGMVWGLGGWLLTPFLQKAGGDTVQRLRARVAAELTTTFASSYAKTVSLREALKPEVIAAYGKQATGSKYLIAPHRT